MTNYNKRLDRLEEQFLADYRSWLDGPWDYNGLNPKQKFHQALTSRYRELVEEARIDELKHLVNDDGIWYQDMTRQFPQKIRLDERIKELQV